MRTCSGEDREDDGHAAHNAAFPASRLRLEEAVPPVPRPRTGRRSLLRWDNGLLRSPAPAAASATIVAVSTAKGALHNPSGLDVQSLLAAREEHGDDFVNRHPEGAVIPPGRELTVDCDILVPAALQDVINDETAHQIKATLVTEGANLPTSPQAQEILAQRGIAVLPDFVANAGGVVAAAFAMDARYSGFRPETPTIFQTISNRLRANAVAVMEEALAHRRRRTSRSGRARNRSCRPFRSSRTRGCRCRHPWLAATCCRR
ncbi:hypothetical protein [Streptomyces sp. V4I23]|uniref:hypothetical protein n=1 Tax=Streptomyces sp. V4I23 TaxID=3042282 RepID=UPI0027D9085D|nr:hypothetical protein [Streptomyces sp. V4I23]